jgi:uncharacterized cupredoxin-like copper-binding protein
MRRALTIATMSLAAAAAAVPAGAIASRPAAHVAASSTVTVTASEFKYKLSKSTVSKGTVTFKIKNAGHVQHDFAIGGKKSKMLSPGASTTLKVTFKKAGRYAYKCTVPGHAQAGMKGTLTVK